MSCIQGLLGSLSYEVESQVKPALKGLTGIIVRGYLPQVWVFETESEVATLRVDLQGNVSTESGGASNRDVTIRWTHDLLATILRSRNRNAIPYGAYPEVKYHTAKGRAAFNYLRSRLGL